MNGKSGRISHYRVLGELGRDRLGYVLRAADEQLDRPVVLRVVRAASVYPPERVRAVRAAFQREARRAARVSHPNLVTLYAFEAIGDIDLIAMEHVEGASLRAMLALGDRWRVPEAAKLVARIADAVAAAHAAHIAHGRLELANVVIRQDGRVKVLDLGVPKLIEAEHGARETDGEPRIARATDPGADVAAMGLIALELASSALRPPGTLWRPAQAGSEEIAAILADPALARARFGILAPVLIRTLLPADRYRDAAELRDAVLAALAEPARSPAPAEIDGPLGPVTRLIVPATAAATPAATGELLDVDAAASDLAAARTPRLVLPADLALSGATPPPGSSFVVMESGVRAERWRKAADVLGDRLSSRVDRVGPGALVAAGLVLVVLLAGLVAARRYLSSGGASAAILAQNGPVTTVGVAPPAEAQPEPAGGAASAAAHTGATDPGAAGVPPATRGAGAPAAERGGEAAPARGFLQRAMVRGSPEGTTIRVVGRDERWRDDVELEVATGDSLVVRFDRPGYVPETHVFRGTRLAVSLRPDSVLARFEANIPAEVFLLAANGSRRRLGTTGSTARLPTGTHRFAFRLPDLPEWITTQGMASPGETYTIRKMDFVAEGSLVLTVADTWARVSIDGGPAEDTPARFDRLSAGPHTVRVTREGYVTITDTVVIRAGQQATKHYTLRPAG